MSEVRSHLSDPTARLPTAVDAAQERIRHADARCGRQADLLRDLAEWAETDLGKWMLLHGGWDARWARYCVDYPRNHGADPQRLASLEHFYLTQAPGIVATQQRAEIFAQVLADVTPNSVAMAVPCGYMDELLRLPDAAAARVLIGVDAEAAALAGAQANAHAHGLMPQCVLAQGDAWDLAGAQVVTGDAATYRRAVCGGSDVVVSNGLNMYVADDDEVTALYRALRTPLRPGGTLVVSALTPPATWDLADVPSEVITRVRGLMVINPMRWGNYRSVGVTCAQLEAAGFAVREVRCDQRQIFPTFVATAV